MPVKFSDPFHSCTLLKYDRYILLLNESKDALNNTVQSVNNYRVLQPEKVKDQNENWTKVTFDALGMVSGTALMGKVNGTGNSTVGDSLEGFESDLTRYQLEEFKNNPREADLNTINESQASKITSDLLHNATTRIVYDLDCFKKYGKPPYAAALVRETHFRDLKGDEKSDLQVSFSYSDGFGREIQKKIQAESGKTLKRIGRKIALNSNGQPEWTDDAIRPRWVGTGWTIFNNKGKPVRQYEPFFSDTHQIDLDAKIGVSPLLFYDPVGRAIVTIHPNHTYEKVVFDAWMQRTYDVNDTIKFDPRTDSDIKGYVEEYYKAEAPIPGDWKTWLQYRDVDPDNPPADTPALDPEYKAGVRSLIHSDTPAVAYLDSLGRTFLTIEHNKFLRWEDNQLKEHEGKYETRIIFDIEGNQREIWDAKGRSVMKYDYSIAGHGDKDKDITNLIHQSSMEAGERWILNDVAGKPVRNWDSRLIIRKIAYDELRRPEKVYVTENDKERLAERTIYGEAQGTLKNHRTRVYKVLDNAGTVTNTEYDFKGNLLENQRELLSDYVQAVNWDINPPTNYGSYINKTDYDALNRPVAAISPDNSRYVPNYNEANLIDKIEVNLRGEIKNGQLNWITFVANIDYNAKGQRELITYGNNTSSAYTYDPFTFRLIHLKTIRPGGYNGISNQLFNDPAVIQDLHYTYDPVGNIIQINDGALKSVIYNSQEVKPEGSYRYDSIYRLIEAHGREHMNQTAFDFNPPNGNYRDYPFSGRRTNPNDLKALRNYIECFEYDDVGNFLKHRHIANGDSWTKHYEYKEESLIEAGKNSNRLTGTTIGNGLNYNEDYTHDIHGNVTSMPHLFSMTWNFKDQLEKADLGGGGTVYYVYDTSGQRVRKVIENQHGIKQKERFYLGEFEIYREFNGNTKTLERESLNIMDSLYRESRNKQRTALVETGTTGTDGSHDQTIRYQTGNHLGSTCLELDNNSALITYEEYHPYGTTSFQAGRSAAEVKLKRYRYTGKERDEESGLDFYGARYYASWLGRWCSCDPKGFIDGINIYFFVKGDPIKYIDLKGKDTGFLGVIATNLENREIMAQQQKNRIEVVKESRGQVKKQLSKKEKEVFKILSDFIDKISSNPDQKKYSTALNQMKDDLIKKIEASGSQENYSSNLKSALGALTRWADATKQPTALNKYGYMQTDDNNLKLRTFSMGDYKCNKFTADVATMDVGLDTTEQLDMPGYPVYPRESTFDSLFLDPNPFNANNLASRERQKIGSLEITNNPSMGDIIAVQNQGGLGHSGIYMGSYNVDSEEVSIYISARDVNARIGSEYQTSHGPQINNIDLADQNVTIRTYATNLK
ncbi:MAG TPA: RHS repeat-associated core domain-containing protein [Bacteroidales bacterium]|nr:RHS repeat-associated core domain-containing protein [Bacteroidales bacterium]